MDTLRQTTRHFIDLIKNQTPEQAQQYYSAEIIPGISRQDAVQLHTLAVSALDASAPKEEQTKRFNRYKAELAKMKKKYRG